MDNATQKLTAPEAAYVKPCDPQQKTLLPPQDGDKEFVALQLFVTQSGRSISEDVGDGTRRNSLQEFLDLLTPGLLARKLRVDGKDTHVLPWLLAQDALPMYSDALAKALERSGASEELKRDIACSPAPDALPPLAYALDGERYPTAEFLIRHRAQTENLRRSFDPNLLPEHFEVGHYEYAGENMFHMIARGGLKMPENFVEFLREENARRKAAGEPELAGMLSKRNTVQWCGTREAWPACEHETPYHVALSTNPILAGQFARIDGGAGAEAPGHAKIYWITAGSASRNPPPCTSLHNTSARKLLEALTQEKTLYDDLIVNYRKLPQEWHTHTADMLASGALDTPEGRPKAGNLMLYMLRGCEPERSGFDGRLARCRDAFARLERFPLNTADERRLAEAHFMGYALRAAAARNDVPMVEALLARGAVDRDSEVRSFTPLDPAISSAIRQEKLEIFDLLTRAAPGPQQVNYANALLAFDRIHGAEALARYKRLKTEHEAQFPGTPFKMTASEEKQREMLGQMIMKPELFAQVIKDDVLPCKSIGTCWECQKTYEHMVERYRSRISPQDRATIAGWLLNKAKETGIQNFRLPDAHFEPLSLRETPEGALGGLQAPAGLPKSAAVLALG